MRSTVARFATLGASTGTATEPVNRFRRQKLFQLKPPEPRQPCRFSTHATIACPEAAETRLNPFSKKGRPSADPSIRVDSLGTVVSSASLGRAVAMFLGAPPELSSTIGGALMGDASSFYVPRIEQALWEEVAEITAHDPAFDIRRFADSTTTAFLKLQRSFAAQDAGAARGILATPLWEQARMQIEEYRRNGRRNVQEQLQIQQVRFLGAHSRNDYDTVGLRVFTATIDYDVDTTGAIVRGDKVLHPVAVDVLAERSSSATTRPDGGTMHERCPNCGAGLQLEWDGSCRFCKSDVMSGAYDWVISKIIQLPDSDQALASAPPDILRK